MVLQDVKKVTIPANAEEQKNLAKLDSRLRGNDRTGRFPAFCETIYRYVHPG